MSKMHNTGKWNQQQSEGAPFPNAIEITLRLWCFLTNIIKLAHKTAYKQIAIFLIIWIKQDLKWLDDPALFPRFKRVSDPSISLEMLKHNVCHLRTIRDGNVSWVEYSAISTVKNEEAAIWLPVPKLFNRFLWHLLENEIYDEPIYVHASKQLISNYLAYHRNLGTAKNINHTIATRKAFENYFTIVLKKDEKLRKTGKSANINTDKLAHRSSEYYAFGTSDQVRFDTYHSNNRALGRLGNVIHTFRFYDAFTFNISSRKKSITIIHGKTLEARFLKTRNDEIPTLLKDRSEMSGVSFGAKFALGWKETNKFLFDLKDKVLSLSKKATLLERINHHNTLTCAMALNLIILTGIRNTHAIGPNLQSLDVSSFMISDKGKARRIFCSKFLVSEMQKYIQHLSIMQSYIPGLESHDCMFVIIDKNTQTAPLNAKFLREFTRSINSKLIPSFFRQSFLQRLEEFHCPSPTVNELMGHSNYGQQAGLVNHLAITNQEQIKYLEKINKQLNPKILFL